MPDAPTPLDLDGVGWYEVTHPTAATTLLAYVHEDGSVYFPETNDGQVEFALAAARGHVHRLVRADDAEAKVERQRDRLRARERQVRRLRAEVTRLHALVADLRATASPAWDEYAAVEGMARAVYPSLFTDDRQPPRSDAELREGERDVARERMRRALAVVRDHQPVKPRREAVARVLAEHRLMGGRCRCGLDPRLDYYRYEQHVTDAVLDLLPGHSEAEVEAEQYEAYRHRIDVLNARLAAIGFPRCACHPAQDDSERCLPDPARWLAQVQAEALRAFTAVLVAEEESIRGYVDFDRHREDRIGRINGLRLAAALAHARADRLAAEGGADRG